MDRLHSRKLWITLAVQVAILVLATVAPGLPEHAVDQVVTLAITYLGAQGAADIVTAARRGKVASD